MALGKPKMPLPMILVSTSAVSVQRPMVRTSWGWGEAFIRCAGSARGERARRRALGASPGCSALPRIRSAAIELPRARGDGLRKFRTPQRHALLRARVGPGREEFEHVGEAQAALEPALGMRIDLRVHLDDGLREGRRALDFLRGGARLL